MSLCHQPGAGNLGSLDLFPVRDELGDWVTALLNQSRAAETQSYPSGSRACAPRKVPLFRRWTHLSTRALPCRSGAERRCCRSASGAPALRARGAAAAGWRSGCEGWEGRVRAVGCSRLTLRCQLLPLALAVCSQLGPVSDFSASSGRRHGRAAMSTTAFTNYSVIYCNFLKYKYYMWFYTVCLSDLSCTQ